MPLTNEQTGCDNLFAFSFVAFRLVAPHRRALAQCNICLLFSFSLNRNEYLNYSFASENPKSGDRAKRFVVLWSNAFKWAIRLRCPPSAPFIAHPFCMVYLYCARCSMLLGSTVFGSSNGWHKNGYGPPTDYTFRVTRGLFIFVLMCAHHRWQW